MVLQLGAIIETILYDLLKVLILLNEAALNYVNDDICLADIN